MQTDQKSKPSTSPTKEVLLVFAASMMSLPVVYGLSLAGDLSLFKSGLYIYGTSLEFLLIGLFPLLLALRDHDRPAFYGIQMSGAARSIILGAVLVAVRAAFQAATGSQPFAIGLAALSQSLAQPFPANLFFSLLTIFSYGPLEVFYITFLVAKLDLAFHPPPGRILTKGMFSGVLLWSLIHLNNAVSSGLESATVQVGTNFVFGVLLMMIYKHTKCSIGPMLSFTINNMLQ